MLVRALLRRRNVTPFREMGLSREVLKRRSLRYRIHFKRQSQKDGLKGQNTIKARPVISFFGTCELSTLVGSAFLRSESRAECIVPHLSRKKNIVPIGPPGTRCGFSSCPR